MKLIKKVGGLLLTFVLIMSMLSVVAFAEAPAGFPAGYEELELEWTELYYYNSAKDVDPISGLRDGSGNYWYVTQKFTKEDLPNGTVIVAGVGIGYQADGWVDGELNESKYRPTEVKNPVTATETKYVVIDDNWWKVTEKVTNPDQSVVYNPTDMVFTERGFNVRVYPLGAKGLKQADDNAQAEVTAKIMEGFKIYVPTGSGSGSGSGTTHTHTYGTAWEKDATNHWHECSCGDKKDTAAHTGDRAEATETDPIKCSVCGYVMTPALSHTHAYGTEWKTNANKHWHECACGAKNAEAAHADADVDGKCDACAYTMPSNNDNPQTGDNSMIALWVMLLCASAFGVVVTMMFRKKRAF